MSGCFWLPVTEDFFLAGLNNKEFLVTYHKGTGGRAVQGSLIQLLEHSIEDLNSFHSHFIGMVLLLALFIPNSTLKAILHFVFSLDQVVSHFKEIS